MKTSSLYFLVRRPFTDHNSDLKKMGTQFLPGSTQLIRTAETWFAQYGYAVHDTGCNIFFLKKFSVKYSAFPV